MRRATYHLRSLVYHWRTNLAVALGTAAGTAAITGALLVGDSMRASLRDLALKRLGTVDYAMISARFFEDTLAERIANGDGFSDRFDRASALILLRGGVTHAERRTRVDGVGVIGIDDGFWAFHNDSQRESPTGAGADRTPNMPPMTAAFTDRTALINQELADELGAQPGDAILVRLGKPSAISTETLLGRRDESVSTLRLTVTGIVTDDYQGQFSLNPAQTVTRNVFIPIETLQRAIDRPGRANAVIVSKSRPAAKMGATGGLSASAKSDAATQPRSDAGIIEPRAQSERPEEIAKGELGIANDESTDKGRAGYARQKESVDPIDQSVYQLQSLLHQSMTLADLGLHLRVDSRRGYVSLESESILIGLDIERELENMRYSGGFLLRPVLAHLANRITNDPDKFGIPYSTIVALSLPRPLDPSKASDGESLGQRRHIGTFGEPIPESIPDTPADGIILNQWAADDLGTKVGDDILVSYYVTTATGELEEHTSSFKLSGFIRLEHEKLGDPGLVPTYPGITNVYRLSDWNAPFPIDFSRIRDKDDQYWEEHRTLPKAYIQLETGQRLWATDADRFGKVTSFQIRAASQECKELNLDTFADEFAKQFLQNASPYRLGLEFQPVRTQALAAATGSTDFGMLFLGFSFFLIISAAMLVALLFRLGIERRAGEIGLLLATGFDSRTVARFLLIQGLGVALAGTIIGVVAARGYAWLMLAGLRTWWSAAVGITALKLAASPVSLGIGATSGTLVALCSIAWSQRGLSRGSPRGLLAGLMSGDQPANRTRARRRSTVVAIVALIGAGGLIALSTRADAQARAGLFFGAGAAGLITLLSWMRRWLYGTPGTTIDPAGSLQVTRLGVRNAPRHPGRSLLTASLIASATFVIVSVQAFRLDADPASLRDKQSGSGGFNLFAEAAVPLPYDILTAQGRDALGLTDNVSDAKIEPLRLRPGDESSCLNLYRPSQPRILAASDALIARGGFAFASTLAETDEEHANPWLLLKKNFPDGAIPAIGDQAAVQWQLHLGLGKDLAVTDERGRQVTLRFVALLSNSLLQDELIIAESPFLSLFPSSAGRSFFLIETPADSEARIEQSLERSLERFGFDVQRSATRLDRYFAVQNTYLATFRNLGGLGLLLGTTGLAAVLLRNVWERRRELALLRAVGFSRGAIGWLVLVENLTLLAVGLGTGVVSSLVAISPMARSVPGSIPWLPLCFTVIAVVVIGCTTCSLALIPALRAPLIPALRRE